jgi:hypothetical protein
MRQVGRRRQPGDAPTSAQQALRDAERITATAVALAQGRCALPKGLRRFKTHEAANEWQDRHLAAFMSELARRRGHG